MSMNREGRPTRPEAGEGEVVGAVEEAGLQVRIGRVPATERLGGGGQVAFQ